MLRYPLSLIDGEMLFETLYSIPLLYLSIYLLSSISPLLSSTLSLSLYPSLILYLPIPSSTLLYLSISPFLSSTLLYLSIHLVSSISPFLSSTLLYSISLSISYPLSPHSFLLLYSISLSISSPLYIALLQNLLLNHYKK